MQAAVFGGVTACCGVIGRRRNAIAIAQKPGIRDRNRVDSPSMVYRFPAKLLRFCPQACGKDTARGTV